MNINLQDLLAIVACILGPIGTLMGFMWQHSNTKFEKLDEKFEKLDEKIDNLRVELKGDINSVEKRLGEKIDSVRDRVSRIEGQLAPASIVAYSPAKHKETTRTHSS